MAYTNCDLILSVKDAEDHKKWLKTRDLGIGGSDAAVIMELNPYKSPYQLWMEKDGRLHRLYGLPGVWYRASDVRDLCEFEEPAHSDEEWEAVTDELLRLKDEVSELRRRLENVQIAACGGESK